MKTKRNYRLCDNPTCPACCEVVFDERCGWRFANGFQMPLTKEQLMNFRPKSKFNVCGRCKGGYDIMQNKCRKIRRQLLESKM